MEFCPYCNMYNCHHIRPNNAQGAGMTNNQLHQYFNSMAAQQLGVVGTSNAITVSNLQPAVNKKLLLLRSTK